MRHRVINLQMTPRLGLAVTVEAFGGRQVCQTGRKYRATLTYKPALFGPPPVVCRTAKDTLCDVTSWAFGFALKLAQDDGTHDYTDQKLAPDPETARKAKALLRLIRLMLLRSAGTLDISDYREQENCVVGAFGRWFSADCKHLLKPLVSEAENARTAATDRQPQQIQERTPTPAQNAEKAPILRQWETVKAKHPDALLLFRLCGYYYALKDDAALAAAALGIPTDTRFGVDAAQFPSNLLDTHLPRLIKSGHRVAVCEELKREGDSAASADEINL